MQGMTMKYLSYFLMASGVLFWIIMLDLIAEAIHSWWFWRRIRKPWSHKKMRWILNRTAEVIKRYGGKHGTL